MNGSTVLKNGMGEWKTINIMKHTIEWFNRRIKKYIYRTIDPDGIRNFRIQVLNSFHADILFHAQEKGFLYSDHRSLTQ